MAIFLVLHGGLILRQLCSHLSVLLSVLLVTWIEPQKLFFDTFNTACPGVLRVRHLSSAVDSKTALLSSPD